ncbi:type II secretion system protein [Candidatus Dojkabacteria bacterium]|uniref:Type II secretion system protein n=1 Tax=Candidatus Dojkabacteria bacterium TaxID=2099670 RepID=A0A955LA62_9BACT|nr:type II secretion system protein [Candidatus Dojkabacteria bacterium]
MKKSAFTLIEMLIAMSIMVIILSFGTIGVVRFRDYIEVQNGYSDVATYVRTIQNKARNSIAYTTIAGVPVAPDYYGIYIEDNNFSLYACTDSGGSQLDCVEQEGNIKSNSFSNVEIELSSGCPGNLIAFKNSSLEIIAVIGDQVLGQLNNANIISTGTCDILVSHVNGGSTRSITINLTQNSIDEQ